MGTEVLVNDDGTTRDQFFPTLSVGEGNTVSAAWYDRRDDPNNILVDYYQRLSYDGGVTWEPSVRVSDVSTPIYLDPNLATCYHGDYDTQVQTETAALIQWSDDRRTSTTRTTTPMSIWTPRRSVCCGNPRHPRPRPGSAATT